MKNESYDPTTSDCCGANRDDDHGICLECKEHCDGITFEDENGEPVKQYVDLEGIIRDQPYAQRGHTPTIGEIVAFGVMVTGLAMFWIGVGR